MSYIGVAAAGQSTWLWRMVNHTRSFASGVTWAATLDQARAHAVTAAAGKAPSQRAARALEAITAAPFPRRPDELEPDEVFLWQRRWWTLRRHLSTEHHGDQVLPAQVADREHPVGRHDLAQRYARLDAKAVGQRWSRAT